MMRTLKLNQELNSKPKTCNCCQITLNTRVSGINLLVKDMAEATRYGLTEASMRDTGRMTKLTVKEDLSMLTEIFMTAIGRMIRPMDSEVILTPMEPSIKDIGKMISNMEKVRNNGLMAHNTQEAINTERKTVLESSCGQTSLLTMVNSLIITSMARVSTDGLTVENTSETG
jgi:hypothetical protein